jgi:hypothetical protein
MSAGFLALGLSVVCVGAAGAWLAWRERLANDHSPKEQAPDPLREARDDDRRLQQRLLAALSRELEPRPCAAGTWGPRGINPASGRSVLEFESERGVGSDGKRRRKRKSPESPLEGPRWPWVLSVDLRGLPEDQARDIAQVVARVSRDLNAGRVRFVLGPEGLGAGDGPVREALTAGGWALREGGGRLDLTAGS